MEVYVRARTADDRWATVNAMDLTDESFKRFILRALAQAGMVAAIVEDGSTVDLETKLTKIEAER